MAMTTIAGTRSLIRYRAATSSVAGGGRLVAAFFDLDKTIIAKWATLPYGPSVYRNGLISRGGGVRSAAAAQLLSAGMGPAIGGWNGSGSRSASCVGTGPLSG